MKKIFLILFIATFALCAAAPSMADQIKLGWNTPIQAKDLPEGEMCKYKLYHKMERNSVFDFSHPIYDGPALTYTDDQTEVGNHRYAVQAYIVDAAGNVKITSGLSNTENYEITASEPDPGPSELDAPTLIIEALEQIQSGIESIKKALASIK